MDHFPCCYAPKDMGHLNGCPNSAENFVTLDVWIWARNGSFSHALGTCHNWQDTWKDITHGPYGDGKWFRHIEKLSREEALTKAREIKERLYAPGSHFGCIGFKVELDDVQVSV
jgi:hypothetical protein